jgi:membrane-bound serine protease (ClpP class)
MCRWCRFTLTLLALAGVPHALAAQPVPLASLEPAALEPIIDFLTNPVVSAVLLSVGVLGILMEIKTGVMGVGGFLSLLALGVFFGSSFLLGFAGWEEVLLLGLGVIALAVEVFILPGFGVAGILGIVSVATAIVLALLGTRPTSADVMQAFAVLGASFVITAAVIYAWLRHLPHSSRFSGLFLHGAVAQSDGYISALPREDLIGMDGVAITDLRPAGTAQIGSERVDVVTEGEYVRQGSPVRVIRSEGYRHVVRGGV